MERECCLSILSTLVGGAALIACGWWPAGDVQARSARVLESITWRRIWRPIAPALISAAVLCGWALAEPDPVPEKVPMALLFASIPFALIFTRAAIRSALALIADPGGLATATVGFLRPWIVFSPHLAKALPNRQIEAALEHEQAHVRHRDPLRIWLAQIATDLQWPWPQARERLREWLIALELARDEEARAAGIDGADLAEVILAAARFSAEANLSTQAALIGEPSALKERIRRLLNPCPAIEERRRAASFGPPFLIVPALTLAIAGGAIFGERLVRALFWIAA
jgi:hypothetical protein